MLARALLLILAIELAIYCALGWWLVATHGWPPRGAAAFCIAILAGVRIAFGLATYAIAWRYAVAIPDPERVRPLAMMRHVAAEIGALVALYGALQPFERLFMGDPAPPRSESGPRGRLPVLLVHGYVLNRAAMWSLERALRARGETVWAVTLEPVYGSIDAWVPQLAARIDALLAAAGAHALVLVGHSMGGLAARAYLRDFGGAKVARLVTLASPHAGSVHAYLGLGANAREMRPGSPWLDVLTRAEAQGLGTKVVSIYTRHDNFVAPSSSCVHPGAENIALSGVGHLAMLFSSAVHAAVARELDAANADARAAPALPPRGSQCSARR